MRNISLNFRGAPSVATSPFKGGKSPKLKLRETGCKMPKGYSYKLDKMNQMILVKSQACLEIIHTHIISPFGDVTRTNKNPAASEFSFSSIDIYSTNLKSLGFALDLRHFL